MLGQSFLPQLMGEDGPAKPWVHVEYRGDRLIRTKEWIYTNKDKLIKVNPLGRPENEAEERSDDPDLCKAMKKVFAKIDSL